MRLDHLLSKEHTPRTVTNRLGLPDWSVWLALVVFTSGIVDEWLEDLGLVGLSTTGRAFGCAGCGTWPAGRGRSGRDTLLSFEESGFPSDRDCSSWPVKTERRSRREAWVGVLFVNWIVDASIFRCLYTRRYRIFDAISNAL